MNKQNKSVLVIDTPNNCKECIFSSISPNVNEMRCCGLMVYLNDELLCTDNFVKPTWCPLLPLPEKIKLR